QLIERSVIGGKRDGLWIVVQPAPPRTCIAVAGRAGELPHIADGGDRVAAADARGDACVCYQRRYGGLQPAVRRHVWHQRKGPRPACAVAGAFTLAEQRVTVRDIEARE